MHKVLLRFFILLAMALIAGQASAHAVLLSSAPAANSMVEDAPALFVLNFNEPVSLLTASLITPDGEQIDVSGGAVNGSALTIKLPTALGRGTHVVSWRVVSVDGHPVGGATPFSVGIVTGANVMVAQTDTVVSGLLWGSKALIYIAVAFGIGTAAIGKLIGAQSRRNAEIAKTLILVGLLATPVSIGLQGTDALALGPVEFFSGKSWSTGFATSYGMTAFAVFVALALGFASFVFANGRAALIVSVIAWAGAAFAFALSGHASAAEPQWLTRPAVFLHLMGLLFWAGALIPLFSLLGERPEEAGAPLARFSRFIPFPVAVLFLSGLTLALIQMGRDSSQWLSSYGYILAAKLTLLAILFALAAWNRFALTAPALAQRPGAVTKLKMSIGIEILIVVLVLALVAVWRFTPPPRALAVQASVPITFHVHSDKAMADVSIEPGRTGANAISFFLMDGEFAPVDPVSVEIGVSVPELGIEASRFEARLDDDGFWRVRDVSLPISAEWQFDLEIRLTRFEMVRLTESFILP